MATVFQEPKEKKKRKSLTGSQKAEVCRLRQEGVSQVKIAEKFSVAEATISGIVHEKERWLALNLIPNSASLKRQRTGKFLLLEEALALWVSRANTALQTITGIIIQCKATQLAKKLEAHYKKIFCEDRIDVFDTFLESGDPLEPITIKDVIDFVAAAWNKDFLSELFPFEELDQDNEPNITKEYVIADANLITTEMPNDDEIIEAVKNRECIEPGDE
ncbi:2131_t:CDS:2, partial [Scutellospora calospora]